MQGIRAGQLLQTTIVDTQIGPIRDSLLGGGISTPSCAGLGDLVPGAVLTSSTGLSVPADGCLDGVLIDPEQLTTAALANGGNEFAFLTLPDGIAATSCGDVFIATNAIVN